VRDPGLDRHEWETEWQALEPLVADSPAESLPEVDELVARMLEAHGYALDEEHELEAAEVEVVKEFRESRRTHGSSTAGRRSIPATSGPRSRATATSTTTSASATSREPVGPPPASARPVEGSPGLLPKATITGADARVCYGSAPKV
jgi:hypothetical protein